ncbi:MAG: hypothetical protein RLZZ28_1089 [Bacteroidota bacterium]|jgi:aldose 1-epimerase
MAFNILLSANSVHPEITLKDTATGTEAVIYTYGGLLNAFSINHRGQAKNIVQGFSSTADARTNGRNGFKSAKLSPFVCRMRRGQFSFEGKKYTIQKNYLQEHAIHGIVFDAVYSIEKMEENESHAFVQLCHEYPGTDSGFPFPYTIRIDWQLEAENKLTVSTHIRHNNPHPIPIADGWHPYFMLGGKVDDWVLQFDSETQLAFDADLLPTGKKISDNRFTNGGSLKGVQLDNSFELDFQKGPAKAVLSNREFVLRILPAKAYPILQVYIPDHRNSIALENLSGAPDNFNNGMGLIILPPGELQTFTTVYQLACL